jgi:hypothetical protein
MVDLSDAPPERWYAGPLLRIELVAVAATFFVFAAFHAAGVVEPRIVPAAIVESLCGVSLALAAGAALLRTTWAWPAAVAANAFSAAGVLLGISVQARGGGGTELNFVYHRAVLAVLLASLVLLLAGRIRGARS